MSVDALFLKQKTSPLRLGEKYVPFGLAALLLRAPPQSRRRSQGGAKGGKRFAYQPILDDFEHVTRGEMKRSLFWIALLVVGLVACNIEEAVHRNDDRYAKPGAMDMPLTGIYKTYQYKLLDKYRVTHQWLNTSSCSYSAYERPSTWSEP